MSKQNLQFKKSDGWNLLVKQLGIENATKIIVLIERGKGDTVQEIADYWGNTGIEGIHHQIMNWKQQQVSQ